MIRSDPALTHQQVACGQQQQGAEDDRRDRSTGLGDLVRRVRLRLVGTGLVLARLVVARSRGHGLCLDGDREEW